MRGGLNKTDNRRLVKNFYHNLGYKHYMFTRNKARRDVEDIVNCIWGGRWASYTCIEASGTRGGIMIIWDRRV